MPEFTHLHVHTKYSLLDGASQVSGLMKKVKENGMKSVAITDHGNMLGVPEFVAEADKAGILPIVGCEFYMAPRSRFDKSKSESDDEKNYYHQLLLAKNPLGYKNLSKLCSLGFIEGYYYKPRIDKELLHQYKDGLIATTSCLASEISRTIINKGEDEGERVFKEYLDMFGEDYYIELQRHGIKEQNICNEVLLKWSKKYNVKIIATNDVHYVDLQDAEAQDILLCIQTGKDFDDPRRMRFDNDQFFLKTPNEMESIFKDIPEALDNTAEIVSKIEPIKLKRDVLLPIYKLPEGFTDADEYLKFLTYTGAKRLYRDLNEEVQTRIEFELGVIKKMGFAGYFLIVQDFIAAARKLGVWVGPGRGSAASSIIAYCTGITNIDPIAYNLLFERFLNPERVSMPDIDIDFDDKGRDKVINYVVEKYGKERVGQIVTIGTMAAKSAIKDVARTLKVPLADATRLTKLVPFGADTLEDAISQVKELSEIKNDPNNPLSKTLSLAQVLDGTARQTGIHAAGVIIAPDDLVNYLPVFKTKDTELLITQYEGKYVESVGMLKMDFLGLKTLTILKDAIALIKKSKGIEIDIDNIPLDDKKTYEMFQRGEMVGIFQFESNGMQQYMKELKPTNIEDLIAMNALYRPGPMDDIPAYIARKNGKEKPQYYHPLAEAVLKPTFGVIVYQEQVMVISQVMADFTKGQADVLRKAMGKKDMALLAKQKEIFVKGAVANGVPEATATELFDKMAKFGGYGFNRAHAAAYSVLAYQTAYLKANYMAEFMASVLTNSMGDIEKLTFFIDECRNIGLTVLGPDINKSEHSFAVTPKGEVSFGLGAVKGVGEAAVGCIVEEREKNGSFKDIYDLMSRINLRSANKKTFESLVMAGAFDSFTGTSRAQFFAAMDNGRETFLEALIRYGNAHQDNSSSSQNSLFGEMTNESIPQPKPPLCQPWSRLEQIGKEKDVAGFYISGHPLDDYKFDLENFCSHSLSQLSELSGLNGKDIVFAGMVTEASHRTSQAGKPFGSLTIEDMTGNLSITLFGENYLKWKHLMEKGTFLHIKAKVQMGFRGDTLEVRPSQLQLLGEVREKLAKSLTIRIPLNTISEDMVKSIFTITSTYPGKCNLKVTLVDSDENMSVELVSKKIKLNLSNDLIRQLDTMAEVSYKLN
ncbi:MAG: DNA polymerase III subunit alpha [Bacteroidia bacterium]